MVSWGDGEDSSSEQSSLGTDSVNTTYDSDFCGLADEGGSTVTCKHGVVAARFVAFDGCWTGRRFLGCAGHDGEPACDFLLWVDGEWPPALRKSLAKLWDLYGQEKQGRVNDALDNMEKRFKLKDEIEKMHIDLRNAQEEMKKIVEEKQVILALKAQAEQGLIDARAELEQKKALDASSSNMHKCMRIKAEKERDQLKEEKRKLEYIIGDLFKLKESTRAKLKKIMEMCDE
ncbi:uncharacterized protein [Lolium perenne]|uniref:uncharacterized protein n=1 Tax=Lolium perenne TaxID=4522 RepID=UPI0021F6343A|nr:uncharacterized protein LOC127301648 [Lolium perenne]